MLTTSIIGSLPAFDQLRDEWSALLSRSASDSVTLTWEWLRTWWSVYGHADRRLRIVVVREADRLIGAAPLLARDARQRRYRALTFRRMELLASGESNGHQVCSDYIDWISEQGRETAVSSAILACLMGTLADEWDELLLPDVPATSPNLGPLHVEAGRYGLVVEVLERQPCSVIRLPDSWTAFLDQAGQGLRYKIKRARRELVQAGGRYDVVQEADELPSAMATLVALHQARWTGRGRAGAFASDLRRTFHEQLMPLVLRQGWLRLGILRIGELPIGAIYNFRYGRRVSFYQSGIDVSARPQLRPGLLMHSFEIEAAIEHGCEEYDFLKRGRSDYKDEWTHTTRDLLCVRVAKPSATERAYAWLRRAHGGARRAKRWLEARSAGGREG